LYLAIKFEESIIIKDSFAARTCPILIGVSHINNLITIFGGELTRNARVKDNIYVLGLLLPAVDVVGHSQHQVGGNQKSCSSE
jgi:hypothetical protein